MIRKSTLLGIVAGVVAVATSAWADPFPWEQLKFFQSPLSGGVGVYPVGAAYNPATDAPAPFLGQDITSTLNPTINSLVLDDFGDYNPGDIHHVTWWGSYENGSTALASAFQISFYTNVPGTVSTPGTLIARDIVNPAATLSDSSSTYTETPVITSIYPSGIPGGPGDGILYQYNAELNFEVPDAYLGNVEWIGIQAISTDPTVVWGWHDRDYGIFDPYANPNDGAAPFYHYADDAVQYTAAGSYQPLYYDPTYDGINTSMDMAFALYTTVPEPGSLTLLAAGFFLLRRHRPRALES